MTVRGHVCSVYGTNGRKTRVIADSCYLGGFFESVQCVIHCFEPSANCLGRSANADAEVLAEFKERSGHHAGFEMSAKQIYELLGVSVAKTREDRGTKLACITENLGVLSEEVVQQRSVCVQKTAGASADGAQVIEGNDGHAFGGVNRASVGEVDDLPHAVDQAGVGENPAAANSTQAVGLCQTAGDNEIGSEMEGGSPRAIE